MKRRLPGLALSGLILLLSGCDHPFNPYRENREQYVLQSFVQGDFGRAPTNVTILLGKASDTTAFDPSLFDARVTVRLNGTTYVASDTFRLTPGSPRNGPRQHVYVCRMPTPGPLQTLALSAVLPDGRLLSAQTVVPALRPIATSFQFPSGIKTTISLPPGIRDWGLSWENDDVSGDHLFFPRLTIQYTKSVHGVDSAGTVSVPLRYVSTPNGTIPIYPTYTTQTSIAIDLPAIDSAMAQVAGGDAVKSAYGVHKALLEVLEYDTPLSKYYASINGSLDEFSIRADQPVYTNVSGGIGIWGSYILHKWEFDMDAGYVKTFGYRFH